MINDLSWFFKNNSCCYLWNGLSNEGHGECCHFIQQDTSAPNVGLLGVGFLFDDFRGDVEGRALDSIVDRSINVSIKQSTGAEIRQLQNPATTQEKIC